MDRPTARHFRADCARIHRDWHSCAKGGDAEGLLALYAEDAVLETPLVPVVLGDAAGGVLRGRDSIRHFLTEGAKRLTKRLTHWHRSDVWLTDGERLLVWEYPHETLEGGQLDILEVMKVVDGLIHKHRIYWGWFGCGLLAGRNGGI